MKNYKKTAAAVLALTMLITASSCGKTAEETEAETTAAETTVTETTIETTETTAETTVEETEVPEETEAAPSFDEQEFDIDEYPFDISEDTFVEASNAIGASVYYDVDDFMSVINGIRSLDSNALDQYQEGITVVTSGDGVADIIGAFNDNPTGEQDDFNSHLTNICVFTACEPMSREYQIIAMYYEVDDPEVLSDWYDSSMFAYMTDATVSMPANNYFTTATTAYASGDARATLTTSTLTEDTLQEGVYPEHSGAYIGFYVNGASGLFISVTDVGDDATGLSMLDDFCDAMGLLNPATQP
jgi:hypothetical protein